MIQNIQIVQLLPLEVSMAKNKMLKLDITFSLTSSLFLLSFLLFLFSFTFELEGSLWQFKHGEGSESNSLEHTEM